MALLDTEGFGMSTNISDYTSIGRFGWASGGANNPYISTNGPLGDNYFSIGSYNYNSTWCRFTQPATGSFFYGERFLFYYYSGMLNYLTFSNSSFVEQFHITVNSLGVISVIRAGTTIGSSATAAISTAVWSYLEVGAILSTTVGSVTIRVNGVVVLNLTGVNNQNASDTTIQYVTFGYNNNFQVGYAAHVYFCDATGPAPWNTFLGDVRIQTVLPVSNDSVQFTPTGTFANWQNAAKVPPVPATSYNTGTLIGAVDTFNVSQVSLASVLGVNVKTLLVKGDAGTRMMSSILKSGSTTIVGNTLSLALNVVQSSIIAQIDPNTGSAWTLPNANAIKAGYKLIS